MFCDLIFCYYFLQQTQLLGFFRVLQSVKRLGFYNGTTLIDDHFGSQIYKREKLVLARQPCLTHCVKRPIWELAMCYCPKEKSTALPGIPTSSDIKTTMAHKGFSSRPEKSRARETQTLRTPSMVNIELSFLGVCIAH